MAKLTLADVANLLGNPTSAANTINANNALVETALENTLSRDGTTPNQMEADIDMNNNDILNVGTLNVDNLLIDGVDIEGTVAEAEAAAERAEAAADTAEDILEEISAIAASSSPVVSHLFDVALAGTSVTIPGGYQVGKVSALYLNGARQTEWVATTGTTVTFPAITAADIPEGETTAEVEVLVGVTTSGLSALDSRYIPQSEKGRDVGDVLTYEDFGGFPTLFTDDRIIFRKPTPTVTDVWNVAVLRDVSALTGGTPGFVNTALLVDTTVDEVDSFEWAFLSKLTVNGAGGGEHVAGYFQGIKNADNSVWSLCTEIRDFTTNPTTGSLGIEVGLFVTGTDGNESRHGIDISVGSADNGTGTNIASSAIRIGPSLGDPARAQLTNGIQLKGRITAAIDMTQLDIAYSDVTVKMPTNGKLSWRDTNQTVRGELAWNSVINSWQMSGVLNATSATAGGATALPATPEGYMHVQINGTMRKIPYYAA